MTARLAPPITSRQHPLIRRCRLVAAGRAEPGVVLLDGEHLVQSALDAHVPIDAVLADGRAAATVDRARAAGLIVHEVSAPILAAATPVRAPSGLVALARWAPITIDAALGASGTLVLALVDVQDPGNVGSVIRSADALGAAAVLALGATADPAGWKALRGAMGSTFRIPIARGPLDEALDRIDARGWTAVVTAPAAGVPLHQYRFDRPTVVLLGNEGRGLPAAATSRARGRLTIPMRPAVESLNVATTAALVAYEARRSLLPR